MKTLLRWAGCLVGMTVAAWGAEDFSKKLTPEEFAAAGLAKLSPAELARLDALVLAQRLGVVTQVREETTVKVREETTAKVKAEVQAAAAAEHTENFLNRLKVVLTPGTEIDYARVETSLVGPYRGYDPGTVITLSNGQRWRVIDGSFWAPGKDANKPRKVIIEAGTLGSFFLNIEDGGRPKVKIVGGGGAERAEAPRAPSTKLQ